MENSLYPRESCIANSSPLGQSKVVNPHLISGEEDLGITLDRPITEVKTSMFHKNLLKACEKLPRDSTEDEDNVCNNQGEEGALLDRQRKRLLITCSPGYLP